MLLRKFSARPGGGPALVSTSFPLIGNWYVIRVVDANGGANGPTKGVFDGVADGEELAAAAVGERTTMKAIITAMRAAVRMAIATIAARKLRRAFVGAVFDAASPTRERLPPATVRTRPPVDAAERGLAVATAGARDAPAPLVFENARAAARASARGDDGPAASAPGDLRVPLVRGGRPMAASDGRRAPASATERTRRASPREAPARGFSRVIFFEDCARGEPLRRGDDCSSTSKVPGTPSLFARSCERERWDTSEPPRIDGRASSEGAEERLSASSTRALPNARALPRARALSRARALASMRALASARPLSLAWSNFGRECTRTRLAARSAAASSSAGMGSLLTDGARPAIARLPPSDW